MTETIKIPNKQGLNLSVDLYRPEGAGRFPFVILLHGFTGSKIERQLTSLAQELAKAGIGAVAFDASGCGASDGTFQHDYRMTNYLTDIDVIYEYTHKLDWVDSERIGMWGHSMGGELTIIWCSAHDGIKAACSCQGPTSMRRASNTADYENFKRNGVDKNSEHFGPIHIPAEFYIDAEKYSALETAPDLNLPILAISGLEDVSVTPEDVQAVFDALNEPKELWEVPGAEHNYKNQPEILPVINARVVEFFQKHL